MQMSITRALRELKLLDKRINDTIDRGNFISSKKGNSDKVERRYTVEEFTTNAQENYQSIIDLIERRKQIKAAIVKSNAENIVEIAEKEYSVAEAIERKDSIKYEKYLLSTLKSQLRRAVSYMERQNEEVEMKLDRMMLEMVGKDGKDDAKKSSEVSKLFLADNEYSLVDPLKLEEKTVTLEKEIDDFLAEVDFVLSEANSINKIEIAD